MYQGSKNCVFGTFRIHVMCTKSSFAAGMECGKIPPEKIPSCAYAQLGNDKLFNL